MKIYFAGSIRGGRHDVGLYSQIIGLLKQYGTVLTEHLGDAKITSQGEDKETKFIYERDVALLKQADIIVAEVTTPSLGVGYEIALAESLNKKIFCLFRPSSNPDGLSAMLSGNDKLKVQNYETFVELKEFFSTNLCK